MTTKSKRGLLSVGFCFVVFAIATTLSLTACTNSTTFVIYNENKHEISDYLFGTFLERVNSWGEFGPDGAYAKKNNAFPPNIDSLFDELDIPIIRFPGGSISEASCFDWTKLIDNAPTREGKRDENIRFGFDEYLRFAEKKDIESILVIGVRNALWDFVSIEEGANMAAALVSYCNSEVGEVTINGVDWAAIRAKNGREKPYGVKYFQVGNEWFVFTGNKILQNLGYTNTESLAKRCLEVNYAYIEAMKNIDPNIKIIVEGRYSYTDEKLVSLILSDTKLKEMSDYAVQHIYKPWEVKNVLTNGVEINKDEWEKLNDADIWYACVGVPNVDKDGRTTIIGHGIDVVEIGKKYGWKMAITEWNWNGWGMDKHPVFGNYFMRGIGAAGFLNALMRMGDTVKIANQSMTIGTSWGINSIRYNIETKEAYIQPTGAVVTFYSQHHGNTRLKMEEKNVGVYKQPYQIGQIESKNKVVLIDAIASASDSSIFFHAINRNFSEDSEVELVLKGFSTTGKARHYLMTGNIDIQGSTPKVYEISTNSVSFEGNKLNIILPKRSVSIIEIMKK